MPGGQTAKTITWLHIAIDWAEFARELLSDDMNLQCNFCLFVNYVPDGVTVFNCGHCGIELSRLIKQFSSVDENSGAENSVEAVLTGDQNEADNVDALLLHEQVDVEVPGAICSMSQDSNSVNASNARAGKRILKWVIFAIGGLAVLLILLFVAMSFLLGNNSDAGEVKDDAAASVVEDILPSWSYEAEFKPGNGRFVLSADGAYAAVVSASSVTVIDMKTGTGVATHSFVDASKDASVFVAGDRFVALNDSKAAIWSIPVSAAAVDSENPSSAAAGSLPGWLPVDVPAGAQLGLRGDLMFWVLETGKKYQLVAADGTAADVSVPVLGAVPVSADASKILWATTSGTLLVTDAAGANSREVSLAKNSEQFTLPENAALVKWLTGDKKDTIYTLWQESGKYLVAAHNANDGQLKHLIPLVDGSEDVKAVKSSDPARLAFGKTVFNTETGETVTLDSPVTGSAGISFMAGANLVKETKGEYSKVTVPDAEAVPVAVTSKGDVVAYGDGKLELWPVQQ